MAMVRYKDRPHDVGVASRFNTHGIGSIIVEWGRAGGMSDENISDLEVVIGSEWKSLSQAFKDKDLITDNYNTHFFPPSTRVDRERGYTL